MTPRELTKLVKTMKALGVTSLKTKGVDISFGKQENPIEPAPVKNVLPITASDSPLAAEEENKIRVKIEEMQSIMQIGDADLVDRLFPVKEANGIEDFPEVD